MAGSLRDQLSEQVEALETASAPIDKVDAGTIAESETVGKVNEEAARQTAADNPRVEELKPGRTAGRARDESGRLLPGKKPQESAAQPATAAQPQVATAQVPAPAAAETPKKINRPSSWKKDHWESFDKLATENPGLAEYINQREAEFAKGVSAYKGEYDRAKPLLEAVAPFQAELSQYRIDPAQHVQRLFTAHRTLALGDPQTKLQMFAQLARDYQVPLDGLFVKDAQGQVFLNPQLTQAQRQQPAPQPQDIRKTVSELLAEERMQQELQAFAGNTEKYPHFSTVRETMAGLLQSGLASDLAEAYEAALRHPRHAEIFDAMQEQQRASDAQRAVEEKRRAADVARRNQISPKSAPSTGQTGGGSGKGLRAVLSEAVDAHGSGRV